jgi:hypothetical protein
MAVRALRAPLPDRGGEGVARDGEVMDC